MSVLSVNGFANISQFAQEQAAKPIPVEMLEVPGHGQVCVALADETPEPQINYGTLDFEKPDLVKKTKYVRPTQQAEQEPEVVFRWTMSPEGTYYKKGLNAGMALMPVREPVNTLAFYGVDAVVLRQEVPFECWFANHGYEAEISDCGETWSARGWAFLALAEGVFRTLVEAVAWLVSKVAECFVTLNHPSDEHLNVLKAQAYGTWLSAAALISPNLAKEKANARDEDNIPQIGSLLSDFKWGTPFVDTRDIPWYNVECCQYPSDKDPIKPEDLGL